MANSKISALTSATTPLAGSEVLPIVQSSTTKQVSVANLTAGRAVSASSLSLTGSPLPVGSGGTGLTSLTANYVPYGNGTSAFSSASTFQADGTRLSVGGALQSGVSLYTNAASGDNKVRFDASAGTTSSYMVFVNTTVSAFGTENSSGGNLVAGSSPYATIISNNSAYPVQIGVNNSVTWTFDTSSNLVPKTAAKGINFTANTGAAGMTSQLLNWYEEGTFTAAVEGSTSAGTASYAAQSATYTRIGRVVYFQIYLVWSGGTGTGDLYVGGLPFQSAAGTAAYGGAFTPVLLNVALSANNYCSGAYVLSSNTKLRFFQTPTGGGAASAVPYDAAGEMMLVGQYFV